MSLALEEFTHVYTLQQESELKRVALANVAARMRGECENSYLPRN